MGDCFITRKSGGGEGLLIENGTLVTDRAIGKIPKSNFLSRGLFPNVSTGSTIEGTTNSTTSR